MVSVSVTVKESIGMQNKITPYLIQKANSFKCTVWLEKDERRINAKSLLGVLSMILTEGMEVNVMADGEDEAVAVETISKLLADGYTAE